jgi:hypothetical protein
MQQFFSSSLNATLKKQNFMLQFFFRSLNATLKQQEPLLVFSIDLLIYKKPSNMLCVFFYSFVVYCMFGMYLYSYEVL